jgi:hypothetical protein
MIILAWIVNLFLIGLSMVMTWIFGLPTSVEDGFFMAVITITPIISCLALRSRARHQGEDSTLGLVRKVIRAKLKKAALD